MSASHTPENARQRFAFSGTVGADGSGRRAGMLWPELRGFGAYAYTEAVRRELIAERKAEGHTKRLESAGFLFEITLDPARCRFGTTSMTLAGELAARTPEIAFDTIMDTFRWSLVRIYGAEQPGLSVGSVAVDFRSLSIRLIRDGARGDQA